MYSPVAAVRPFLLCPFSLLHPAGEGPAAQAAVHPARGSRSARLPHPARARAQQIRHAGLLVRRQDGDFLAGFSVAATTAAAQGSTAPPGCPASPPDASDSAQRSRRPRHRAHAVLLQLLAALEDSLIRHFLARKDHLVVDFAQKLELHREIVRSSVHHVAGQRGEPDFLVQSTPIAPPATTWPLFWADDCVIRAGIQVSKLSVLFHNHSLRSFRILSCVLFNFFKLGSQFIKQNTFQHLSSTNREVSQSLLLFPRFLLDCLYRINEFFQEDRLYTVPAPQL